MCVCVCVCVCVVCLCVCDIPNLFIHSFCQMKNPNSQPGVCVCVCVFVCVFVCMRVMWCEVERKREMINTVVQNVSHSVL